MQRNTKQRELLIEIMSNSPGPMSPGEIYDRLHEQMPRLAKSTIYRNIENLLKEGMVDKYYLNDSEIFYKLKEQKRAHAHYLVCEKCKRMFELPYCPITGFEPLIKQMGFKVKDHYIQISGICAECQKKEKDGKDDE